MISLYLEPRWNLMPKQIAPLSAVQVAALKPIAGRTQAELADGQVPGLRVRVNAAGDLTWSLNIRGPDGIRKRFEVGAGLTLAQARRAAEVVRSQVRSGVDPGAAKRTTRARAKLAQGGVGTLEAVLDNYFSMGQGAALASKVEQLRRIKSVFSMQLAKPALEITPAQLQLAADSLLSGSSAARAVAYIKPVMRWAGKRDLTQRGFADLEKPSVGEGIGGQRVLGATELKQVLPLFRESDHGRCCLFMLLTGCRLTEAVKATWGEIDVKAAVWTIAAGRRKDTRSRARKKAVAAVPLVVPLSKQVLALLGKQMAPEELLFPGPTGAALQNWDRWQKAATKDIKVKDWDRHTLRRTCATIAGDMGAAPHVVSVLLGHRNIGDPLVAGYNKSRYGREHAEALQNVANFIDGLAGGNVVLLRETSVTGRVEAHLGPKGSNG